MGLAGVIGKNRFLESRDDALEILSFIGRRASERSTQVAARKTRYYRFVPDRREMLSYDVGDSIAESPHRFKIEV
jgi:hypothetical protein